MGSPSQAWGPQAWNPKPRLGVPEPRLGRPQPKLGDRLVTANKWKQRTCIGSLDRTMFDLLIRHNLIGTLAARTITVDN